MSFALVCRGAPLAGCLLGTLMGGACTASPTAAPLGEHPSVTHTAPAGAGTPGRPGTGSTAGVPADSTPRRFRYPLPGMPPVISGDVYAAAGAGRLAPTAQADPARVYVPDSSPGGTTVTVISQPTHRVVRTIHVGHLTQHVIPSYELRRLSHCHDDPTAVPHQGAMPSCQWDATPPAQGGGSPG